MGFFNDLKEKLFSSPEDNASSSEKRRFSYFTHALDKYGLKEGTGHKRILIPKTALSSSNIENLGFEEVSLAIPESGQETFASYRHQNNNYHIHNQGDYWSMHEDEHAALTMSLKKKNATLETGLEGISHVVEEGVPGLFYYMKGLVTGGDDMGTRLEKNLDKDYMRRAKTLPSLNNNSSRFSAHDDNYNTIEGLRHGGQAEKERKRHTEFGSGWDKLRALTRSLGHDYDSFIQSSHFQQKLSSGSVVRSLGGGAFGEAHLMEMSIGTGKKAWFGLGKEKTIPFQYVRKTFDNKSNMADVMHEVRGMSMLQDTNVPSVYGVSPKKQIFMEAMEGRMVDKEYLKGQIPQSAISDLRGFMTEMHSRGMAHMDLGQNARFFKKVGSAEIEDRLPYLDDIVPRNMMITSEGRMAVLDMGLWQKADKSVKDTFENVSLVKGHNIGTFAEYSMGIKARTAQDVDLAVISSLERHQGKLSSAGHELMNKTFYSESQIKQGVAATVLPSTPITDPGKKKLAKHQQSISTKSAVATAAHLGKDGGRNSKSKAANASIGFGPTLIKG